MRRACSHSSLVGPLMHHPRVGGCLAVLAASPLTVGTPRAALTPNLARTATRADRAKKGSKLVRPAHGVVTGTLRILVR
jgi:hypothetical protein